MRVRYIALIVIVAVVTTFGCRSRKKDVPAPQPAPPAVVQPPATAPAAPVEPPSHDFQPPPSSEEVLSSNLDEANRTVQQRGWIRDAYFAFDASTLDASAQEALQQSASWLNKHTEYGLLVEGHCDERGTEQYNLALGERRAHTASEYLATLGVDGARIQTLSYGEERPFVQGSNEEAWAQNRRTHLVLVKRK